MTSPQSKHSRWYAGLTSAALLLVAATTSALAQPAPGPPPAEGSEPAMLPAEESPPPMATPPPEAAPPPAPPPPAAEAPPSYPRMGKAHQIEVGPDTWFRFGVQMQYWLNYQQSPARIAGDDGGYSFDSFMRRTRFLLAAQLLKGVSTFMLFDSPNLGRTAVTGTGTDAVVSKTLAPMIIQDAYVGVEVIKDDFMIEGGLMILPFSHNGLQGTTSYLSLDVNNNVAVLAGTATSALRDVGVQLKGYVLDDRLEYRIGTFSGLRQPPDGGDPAAHNAPRIIGHVQYQLFDIEKGYFYSGYNFGKKKRLGLSAGFDFQKAENVGAVSAKAYSAFSAGIFGNWPLSGKANPEGGDELAFVAEFYRYDGGTTFAIPEQNDVSVEAAYYNKAMNASVFGKFEMQQLADDAAGAAGTAGNKRWAGGGIKYFLAENSLNFTLAYNRVMYPDAPSAAVNSTNQFTLQLQAFYF